MEGHLTPKGDPVHRRLEHETRDEHPQKHPGQEQAHDFVGNVLKPNGIAPRQEGGRQPGDELVITAQRSNFTAEFIPGGFGQMIVDACPVIEDDAIALHHNAEWPIDIVQNGSLWNRQKQSAAHGTDGARDADHRIKAALLIP